ncbi:MAG: YjgP/YjgQ family permease [Acidobacteria bacterium]|nr:YjgP/YjgQ family permease [Acidobacteriota bacterium]
MRILDRYLIREILPPFLIWLVILTFVLMIPTVLREAEALIAKGVEWSIIWRVLLTLLPSSLAITIPMSLVLGILVGFGRLSADREFVAMQACGVSIYQLIRPVALVALLAAGADAYEMIVALPEGNQTFREITFNVLEGRVERDVKPRVFFQEFPNRVLYIGDVVQGGWRDVFLADSSRNGQLSVFFAREGRLIVNRDKRTVMLELKDGTGHTIATNKPEEYEGDSFATRVVDLDADSVFPRTTPVKGVTEMTIAELRASIAEDVKHGGQGYNQRFMIQQKFSFPAAALVLALIGLGLGVSHRKDGHLASVVFGVAVIFIFYILLWISRAAAIGGQFPAELAPWVPDVLFAVVGIALLLWRVRSADRPIRFGIPTFRRSSGAGNPTLSLPSRGGQPGRVMLQLSRLGLPRPGLLDLYVARQYLRVFLLSVTALLGLFYISKFIDLADRLFRGTATLSMVFRYFYFETPQYIYWTIPIAALLATLVTVGLMTKNSELVVIKACGVSLYRASAPLVLFAIAASGVLFGLQEQLLAVTNREADRLDRAIRGLPPQSFGALDRRWTLGQNGDIYHYDFYDPSASEFTALSTYRLARSGWRLGSLTQAARVHLVSGPDADGATFVWKGSNGWTRDFSQSAGGTKDLVTYTPFAERNLQLESPSYFRTDEPEPEQMTYGQLQGYILQLQRGGHDVAPYLVSLQRKVAFPFVTVIMTLLAVPFAVTTGRRGAVYGIGVGIVLAIVYWTMLSVCAALGTGGLLSPTLAAWAPNIFFGAAAIYMLLTVRT